MDAASQYSIHSICRICLEYLQTENAYDLFCIPGLAKKLCVCTSLSVEDQDGFPKNICGVCYTRLNDLHEFQKLCVDSVQKFQEMVTNNTFNAGPMNPFDLMEPGTAGTGYGNLHVTNDDDDEPTNYDPLLHHKLELIENEDDVFKLLENVEKDDDEIDQKDTVPKLEPIKKKEKHVFSESSSESDGDDADFEPGTAAATENVDESDDDKPLASRLRASSRRKIVRYVTATQNIDALSTIEQPKPDPDADPWDDGSWNDDTDDDEPPKAPKPPKPKRKRIPAAERHLHRIITCHICNKKFKKAERYQSHMKYHDDKLPHQCSVTTCLKGFTTANGLRLHVEHCHADTLESFTCPEEGCGRTFIRTRLLNWHLKKVHKINKELIEPKCFPCNECDKVFRCPMALKKHMYKHDGKELPYPCNICGKRFVINSALKEHLMRHAGIKNYVCPYCGVGKTTRQEWNTHINTHTQEKKFKCALCPHASHNKQNLRMHVKIVHEKIKNYACQYCGKTFGKSNACKMHEMTHTGEKRCECKVCGKRFLYAKGLTKHLKTHEKRVLRAIEVYRKRQAEIGEIPADQVAASIPDLPQPENHSKETHAMVAQEILKVCAESAATIPRDPRRVEVVDIEQLAGTSVNPIPSVAVPSWSPQINFMMKEGPHICPDCGQGFNGQGNLKRHHRIVHEGVKDFACRFCHRRFAKAQTLKHHEMTHTGEKPHQCSQCEMRFIQYVALKRHMKVHENRPPVIPASVYHAREELALQEREKMEVKRQAAKKREAIAELAKEQLTEIQQQEELLKIQQQQELSAAETSEAAGTSTEAVAEPPSEELGEFPHINTSTMGIRTVGVNDS